MSQSNSISSSPGGFHRPSAENSAQEQGIQDSAAEKSPLLQDVFKPLHPKETQEEKLYYELCKTVAFLFPKAYQKHAGYLDPSRIVANDFADFQNKFLGALNSTALPELQALYQETLQKPEYQALWHLLFKNSRHSLVKSSGEAKVEAEKSAAQVRALWDLVHQLQKELKLVEHGEAFQEDQVLAGLKGLLGPLVFSIMRDQKGDLNLSRLQAKDVQDLKQLLQDQLAIDGIILKSYASVLDDKKFAPLLQFLKDKLPNRGVDAEPTEESEELLASSEPPSLLERIFASNGQSGGPLLMTVSLGGSGRTKEPEKPEEVPELSSEELLSLLHDFSFAIAKIDTKRFAQNHLGSEAGREHLKGLLNDSQTATRETRIDLVKSIASVGEDFEVAAVHCIQVVEAISHWNYFNISVTESELNAATNHAMSIIDASAWMETQAEQETTKFQDDPNYFQSHILRSDKLDTPLTPELIPQYRERLKSLESKLSNQYHPVKKLESKLLHFLLFNVNNRNFAHQSNYLSNRDNRALVVNQTLKFLGEIQKVNSETKLIQFNQRLQEEFLHGDLAFKGMEDVTWLGWLDTHVVGHHLSDLFDHMPTAFRGSWDSLVQYSDKIAHAVDLGHRVRMTPGRVKAQDPQLKQAVSSFIMGLQGVQLELPYGYKQQGSLSRFLSAAGDVVGVGTREDIREANQVLAGMIEDLQQVTSKEELKEIVQQLNQEVRAGGVLHTAFKEIEPTLLEEMINLGEFVLEMAAISLVTGGIGTGAAVVEVAGVVRKTHGMLGTLRNARKVLKAGSELKKLRQATQSTGLLAKMSHGVYMGATSVGLNEAIAKGSGQAGMEDHDLGSGLLSMGATAFAMGVFTPLLAGFASKIEGNFIQRLIGSYTEGSFKQKLTRWVAYAGGETGEELTDVAVQNFGMGKGHVDWQDARRLGIVSTAGGGMKMRTLLASAPQGQSQQTSLEEDSSAEVDITEASIISDLQENLEESAKPIGVFAKAGAVGALGLGALGLLTGSEGLLQAAQVLGAGLAMALPVVGMAISDEQRAELERLESELESPLSARRSEAIATLGSLISKLEFPDNVEWVERLVPFLEDNFSLVRETTIQWLGRRIAPGLPHENRLYIAELLEGKLKDKSTQIRSHAIWALAELVASLEEEHRLVWADKVLNAILQYTKGPWDVTCQRSLAAIGGYLKDDGRRFSFTGRPTALLHDVWSFDLEYEVALKAAMNLTTIFSLNVDLNYFLRPRFGQGRSSDNQWVATYGTLASLPHVNGDFQRVIQRTLTSEADSDTIAWALLNILSNPNFDGNFEEVFKGIKNKLSDGGAFANMLDDLAEGRSDAFSELLSPEPPSLLPEWLKRNAPLSLQRIPPTFSARFFAYLFSKLKDAKPESLELKRRRESLWDAIILGFNSEHTRVAFIQSAPSFFENSTSEDERMAFAKQIYQARQDENAQVKEAAEQAWASEKIPADIKEQIVQEESDKANKQSSPKGPGSILTGIGVGLATFLGSDIVHAMVKHGNDLANQVGQSVSSGSWVEGIVALVASLAVALPVVGMAVGGNGDGKNGDHEEQFDQETILDRIGQYYDEGSYLAALDKANLHEINVSLDVRCCEHIARNSSDPNIIDRANALRKKLSKFRAMVRLLREIDPDLILATFEPAAPSPDIDIEAVLRDAEIRRAQQTEPQVQFNQATIVARIGQYYDEDSYLTDLEGVLKTGKVGVLDLPLEIACCAYIGKQHSRDPVLYGRANELWKKLVSLLPEGSKSPLEFPKPDDQLTPEGVDGVSDDDIEVEGLEADTLNKLRDDRLPAGFTASVMQGATEMLLRDFSSAMQSAMVAIDRGEKPDIEGIEITSILSLISRAEDPSVPLWDLAMLAVLNHSQMMDYIEQEVQMGAKLHFIALIASHMMDYYIEETHVTNHPLEAEIDMSLRRFMKLGPRVLALISQTMFYESIKAQWDALLTWQSEEISSEDRVAYARLKDEVDKVEGEIRAGREVDVASVDIAKQLPIIEKLGLGVGYLVRLAVLNHPQAFRAINDMMLTTEDPQLIEGIVGSSVDLYLAYLDPNESAFPTNRYALESCRQFIKLLPGLIKKFEEQGHYELSTFLSMRFLTNILINPKIDSSVKQAAEEVMESLSSEMHEVLGIKVAQLDEDTMENVNQRLDFFDLSGKSPSETIGIALQFVNQAQLAQRGNGAFQMLIPQNAHPAFRFAMYSSMSWLLMGGASSQHYQQIWNNAEMQYLAGDLDRDHRRPYVEPIVRFFIARGVEEAKEFARKNGIVTDDLH